MEDVFLFARGNWPVLVICSGMIAAAVIDWWTFKVPNKLTFPLIVSGWLLGLWNNLDTCFGFGLGAGPGDGALGGIGTSLLGTALAGSLMLPIYAIGGMGAGDVKMTMGFGSWIGAFYGFGMEEAGVRVVPNGMDVIWWAFCAGVVAGGIIGL